MWVTLFAFLLELLEGKRRDKVLNIPYLYVTMRPLRLLNNILMTGVHFGDVSVTGRVPVETSEQTHSEL